MTRDPQTSPRTKPHAERKRENINDMTHSLLTVYKTRHRTASHLGHMVQKGTILYSSPAI